MDPKQKFFVGCTIVLSLAAIGSIVASFVTDHWVRAEARKRNLTAADNSTNTQDDGTQKFTGNITFGLFKGERAINFGFGVRKSFITGTNYFYLFATLDLAACT